jgi:hypothetical protein
MGSKNAHRQTQVEVKDTFTDWLNGLVSAFYSERLIKLVQRLDKYLNPNGNHTEK